MTEEEQRDVNVWAAAAARGAEAIEDYDFPAIVLDLIAIIHRLEAAK